MQIYSIPKIVSGATTILFEHGYIDPVFNDPQIIEQRSELNGHRNFVNKGDRSHYLITVHLFHYAAPSTAFNTMLTLRGVYADEFYPDKDGNAIKNTNGELASFSVTSITPVYIFSNGKRQLSVAYIRLDSQKFVKYLKPKYTYLGDDSGNIIGDDDGFKIIL